MHCMLSLTGNILSRDNIVYMGLAGKGEIGYVKYTHSLILVMHFSDTLNHSKSE